jgi:hypothetical protein
MAQMGLGPLYDACLKRKFRWTFQLDGIISDVEMNALFPLKGARPHLQFKEIETKHIFETIYFHGRPEWKPLQITQQLHPVFNWITEVYDSGTDSQGYFQPVDRPRNSDSGSFKKTANLILYDGCGKELEKWILENCYPVQSNFGELDMGNSEVVTCDVTLRFDRAKMIEV